MSIRRVVRGVPDGGTAGQVLAKVDGVDGNTHFVDAPSGGMAVGSAVSGGSTNKILFVDPSGDLAQAALLWDEPSKTLTFPSNGPHSMGLAVTQQGSSYVFQWRFGQDIAGQIGCYTEDAVTAGPIFQMFPDSFPGLAGQVYFDAGNASSASLVFRTGAGSGAEVTRVAIPKGGPIEAFGDGAGDIFQWKGSGGTTTVASVDASGNITTPGLTGKPAISAHTNPITADADGATVTLDCGVSDWHAVTLGGNRTLTPANDSTGQPITLILTQDATGSRTVTWWSGIRWPGGSVPTLTTTPNKSDVFTFKKVGPGSYYGFVAGLNI